MSHMLEVIERQEREREQKYLKLEKAISVLKEIADDTLKEHLISLLEIDKLSSAWIRRNIMMDMTNQELDKIEKKARWSGWDRDGGMKVVLLLISELRKYIKKTEIDDHRTDHETENGTPNCS